MLLLLLFCPSGFTYRRFFEGDKAPGAAGASETGAATTAVRYIGAAHPEPDSSRAAAFRCGSSVSVALRFLAVAAAAIVHFLPDGSAPACVAVIALQLLSADCPLPPRVSAALFSLLYRHSLPLLLHPKQQQQLLFASFRGEQEQNWGTVAGHRRSLLSGMEPKVLERLLADAWRRKRQRAEATDQSAIIRLLACCL